MSEPAPEIRVTKSPGQSWPVRFRKGPDHCPDCAPGDLESTTLASVDALTGSLGSLGGPFPGLPPSGRPASTGATALAALPDVAIVGLAPGDVLRYSEANVWRNYPESNITDGGNF